MKNLIRRLRIILRRILGVRARTVWISHPMFLRHEPGGTHPESPQRITAILEELKHRKIWRRLQAAEAEEVSDAQLALVHPRRYLRFLESVQPQEGKIYRLDDDTVISNRSLEAARFAAGAVIKAVNMVMDKKACHAFCAVRPPGHHAQSSQAGGFCLLNNVAVGAMHAIAEYRLQRIAIIDFDVHYGDGTAEIFKDDPRILFFNAFETDLFPFPDLSNGITGSANMLHTPFAAGTDRPTFRDTIRKQWLPRLAAFKPELVLLCAGFDAHRDDETGRLKLHEADFAWLTHKIVQTASSCKGKIVSALEGGYTLDSLAKSAAEHIHVLAGMKKSDTAVQYDHFLKNDGRKKILNKLSIRPSEKTGNTSKSP